MVEIKSAHGRNVSDLPELIANEVRTIVSVLNQRFNEVNYVVWNARIDTGIKPYLGNLPTRMTNFDSTVYSRVGAYFDPARPDDPVVERGITMLDVEWNQGAGPIADEDITSYTVSYFDTEAAENG